MYIGAYYPYGLSGRNMRNIAVRVTGHPGIRSEPKGLFPMNCSRQQKMNADTAGKTDFRHIAAPCLTKH